MTKQLEEICFYPLSPLNVWPLDGEVAAVASFSFFPFQCIGCQDYFALATNFCGYKI
jgi:hypothetical protein